VTQLYTQAPGTLLILIVSYDTNGLRWVYSQPPQRSYMHLILFKILYTYES
jgi:hypothetical protein